MTREQLEHAIRAVCDLTGDDAVHVFGSQAILGEYPDPPVALMASIEVDMSPVTEVDKVDLVDAVMGQDSLFHETHGFYVQGVPIEEAAVLPVGWRTRLVRVCNPNTRHHTGWCLEAHDLAASKLAAFREKDRDFVRVMLTEGLVDPETLRRRVATMSLPGGQAPILETWIGGQARGRQ